MSTTSTRLFVLMHSFGGGAEQVALTLARHVHARHVTCTLGCTRHIPALAAHAPPAVPLLMPARPGFFSQWGYMLRLWREARRSDVVLGSLELQSIFWAALFAPQRAVAWLHKDVRGYLALKGKAYNWLYTTLLGWAFRRCRAVVCVSQGIADSTAQLLPALAPRLCVLWNPVDIADLRQRAALPLATALEPVFTKPVVLAVGRLAQQKNFPLLIQAHTLLRQRLPHHLCIIGEGPERPYLEAEVQRRGVADSVFLPGFLDPCPAMARAQVLTLSSFFEGLPTVIIEALALGLPVVSVNCPSGPREVLNDGLYGTLTPVNDAEALATALEHCLRHPPDAQARERGQQRAQQFDLASTCRAWEALLTDDTP